jgi:hypothetical protein
MQYCFSGARDYACATGQERAFDAISDRRRRLQPGLVRLLPLQPMLGKLADML